MRHIEIPGTDLTVSRIALGCALLGKPWDSVDFIDDAVEVIRAGLAAGIDFLDTADVYGHGRAEEAIGVVLSESPGLRDELVIQTKCGDRFAERGQADNSAAHIVASAEQSLARLRTDRIDLYLLHWPDSLVEPDEVARAFDDLHAAGKVRWFGVSNHGRDQVELLRQHVRQPIVVNQVQLGLFHWLARGEPFKEAFTHEADGARMVDYCRATGIQVQAWSSLRSSSDLPLFAPVDDAPESLRPALRLLDEIGGRHGVDRAAVMLAWLLRHPAGIVPILGARRPDRIGANVAAVEVELDREEWYALLHAAVGATGDAT